MTMMLRHLEFLLCEKLKKKIKSINYKKGKSLISCEAKVNVLRCEKCETLTTIIKTT